MFEGYQNIEDDLFIKSGAEDALKKLDSLILDIDGVILDVSASFRRSISLTTQFYFESYLGWPKGPTLIEPEETDGFKLARGFNNDWELTDAAVLFYLVRSVRLDTKDLREIREDGKPLESFIREVEGLGGGLAAAKKAAGAELKKVEKLWERAKIKQIFQEIYAGVDHCKEIYGFDPAFVFQKGLVNEERVLIDPELIEPFLPKVGVITGRTSKEAALALEMAGLKSMIDPAALIGDDGGARKPDPALLITLGDRFKTGVGVYVGDTRDDLEMVKNFKDLKRDETFLSCMVSYDLSKAAPFALGGADILATSANAFLDFVTSLK